MEIPKDKILELLQQQGKDDQVEPAREEPVSYTHLTLPTTPYV